MSIEQRLYRTYIIKQNLNRMYHCVVIQLFSLPGSLQNAYGKETSSSTHHKVFNNDQKAVEFLKKLSERAHPQQPTPKYNTASDINLHHVVSTRFMKEMAKLFFSLPELNQCNIIAAVSRTAGCKLSDIAEFLVNLTETKHDAAIVSCPADGSIKYGTSCSEANKTIVVSSIGNELLEVFRKLPAPFKCNVVNTVALIYNLKGRRHLANKFSNQELTARKARDMVMKIYPSVSVPKTCIDPEVPVNHLMPSAPLVNITVNLGNGNKTSWLESLKEKGPNILRAVYEYEALKKKIIGQGSTEQYLEEQKEVIASAQFVLVTVNSSNNPFSVLFKLKVKRKQSNQLREMKSTYRIVQALAGKTQQQLRKIFNASVVSVGLSREQSKLTGKSPDENKWNLNQISKAKDMFPKHLSKYYKQLAKTARCVVIYYISKKMKKSPRTMEMLYNSYNQLSRKHCCYYTERAVSTDTPITIPFTEEIFRNTLASFSTVTYKTRVRIPERNDPTMEIVSEKAVSKDSSALEIALFTLLGLLCVIILVFTVNWVTALKSRPKYQNNSVPNGTPPTVVLQGSAVSSSGNSGQHDCVYVINGYQRNKRQLRPSVKTHLSTATENKLSKLNSAQPSHDHGCADKNACPESSPSFLETVDITTSGNTGARVENEYCAIDYPLQQQRNGNTPVESPWRKHLPEKTACHQGRKETLDHSVWDCERDLESQGKAISYCSIYDSSRKVQPHRTIGPGCMPSEQSHKMVVVMLDSKETKEEEV